MSYDRQLMRGLNGELNRWGRWVESRLDWAGYPRSSAYAESLVELAALQKKRLTANGKQTRVISSGHRVLMLDMPTEIYAVDRRVTRLPEELQRIVWAQYVFILKNDGTVWSFQEKAERLNVPRGIFKQMLYEAKLLIAGLTPNESKAQYPAEVGDSVKAPRFTRPAA